MQPEDSIDPCQQCQGPILTKRRHAAEPRKFCSKGCANRAPRGDRTTPVMVRIARRLNRNGPIPIGRPDLGPCWTWNGNHSTNGYAGPICVAGQVYKLVHVILYETVFGPVPDGKELDHLCRNRGCSHPKHLEPVTHQENCLRGNSPWAQYARRTHCERGHLLVEQNGGRFCRDCRRKTGREWMRRKRAKNGR